MRSFFKSNTQIRERSKRFTKSWVFPKRTRNVTILTLPVEAEGELSKELYRTGFLHVPTPEQHPESGNRSNRSLVAPAMGRAGRCDHACHHRGSRGRCAVPLAALELGGQAEDTGGRGAGAGPDHVTAVTAPRPPSPPPARLPLPACPALSPARRRPLLLSRPSATEPEPKPPPLPPQPQPPALW